MSNRGDRAFLEDMLARIELASTFTAEGRAALDRSRMMQEAVIRTLEVIGEASRNVSDELRLAHPEIPWREIAAFRNFVIHAYWNIKMDRVWEVVSKELPSLKAQITSLLAALPTSDDDPHTSP